MLPWLVSAALTVLVLLLAWRLYDNEARLADALRRATASDPLTGLLARRGFEGRLDEELERARRHGRPLALILAGVDDLRQVNALLGHRAGDVVLQQVGGILRDGARRVDAVGRVGSGTFALLVPEEDERGALALAERLRGEVRTAFAGGVAEVTVSLGVASLEREGPAGAPLEAAGRALHLAKELGGDRAVVYSDETVALLAKLASPR